MPEFQCFNAASSELLCTDKGLAQDNTIDLNDDAIYVSGTYSVNAHDTLEYH